MTPDFEKSEVEQLLTMTRQTRLIVMAIAAIAILSLAAITVVLVKLPTLMLVTGTEPPIHVKGGSMHFELLASGSTFTPSKPGNTSDTDWTVEPGARYDDNINVMIATPTAMANCPLVNLHAGKVTFEYKSDVAGITNKVTIHSQSKKTTIKADYPLKLEADGTLSFDKDNSGYISGIKTPGGANCTFTSSTQLTDVTITE